MRMLRKRFAMLLALSIFGCGCSVKADPMDLRTMDRTSSPNDALACPPAICSATSDMEPSPLDLGAEQLGEVVRKVISAQPRTELVGEDPDLGQLVFVQRSRIFGFADTIWIQTVDLEPEVSLIMYSRSNFGFWDLGVNRRRVSAWLSEIESATDPEAHKAAASPTPPRGKAKLR